MQCLLDFLTTFHVRFISTKVLEHTQSKIYNEGRELAFLNNNKSSRENVEFVETEIRVVLQRLKKYLQ
jgi:hypothetical protein